MDKGKTYRGAEALEPETLTLVKGANPSGIGSERFAQSGWEAQMQAMSERLAAKMAPPGGIPAIPELLEQRRLQYGITDAAFAVRAQFENVYVHQIATHDQETTDGGIMLADSTRKRLLHSAPRGIIVSAGARALECLWSNGMDLGYIVDLIQVVPYRREIDMTLDLYLLIIKAGDIVGSEDTRRLETEGKLRLAPYVDPDGQTRARYERRVGDAWTAVGNPTLPWVSADQ